MTVSPQAFLEVAQGLIHNHDEIHDRSATNRAYYGAFHACKNLVTTLHMNATGRGSHQRVLNALRNHTFASQDESTRKQTEQIRFIAMILPEVKLLREDADYKILYNFPEENATRAVQLSQAIIQIVDQLCPNK